jgi:3-oxoacyl-[acyl-carrier-protein] synthase-3
VLAVDLGALPDTGELLEIPAGGAAKPATLETVAAGLHYVTMQGREVFKHAVRAMGDSSAVVIAAAGITPDDVKVLIPHQANLRIIEATAKRLNVSMERVFVNVDRYGNTSAATIPIAICEAHAEGRLCPGDYVVLTAFGGGLTWASALVQWSN